MENFIRTLTIQFNIEISDKEIPLFRGAILNSLGEEADLHYHNHIDSSFLYSYPIIQYKRLNGKAAIVCIGSGVDIIGHFLWNFPNEIHLGKRTEKLEIVKMVPRRILIQIWNGTFTYHIKKWLPLNAKNYSLYQENETDEERLLLLNKILTANLLSMLKGLGIHIEKTLQVNITNVSKPYILFNKGVGMTAFSIDFSSNLSIPNDIGIGKNASIGYGVIYKYNMNKSTGDHDTNA